MRNANLGPREDRWQFGSIPNRSVMGGELSTFSSYNIRYSELKSRDPRDDCVSSLQ